MTLADKAKPPGDVICRLGVLGFKQNKEARP